VEIDLDAIEAKYPTQSTSKDSMEFAPIKLAKREPAENERSRKLLSATAVRNVHDAKESLQIRLRYQRKHHQREGVTDEYANLNRLKLTSVQAGEEVQIDLDSRQTAQLAELLCHLYTIAARGIVQGAQTHTVLLSTDADLLAELSRLLANPAFGRGAAVEFLRRIADRDPEALELAALQARHNQHTQALEEFRIQLEAGTWTERDWEAFFKANDWIFGYGLSYQFLSELQAQPNYGGTAVSGRGAQKGDHLRTTSGQARFTVLVEVKTPQAPLVLDKEYRNGVHVLGADVTGGASQLQVNARMWAQEGSRSEANRGLEDEDIYTVDPKSILVVGNLATLKGQQARAKRQTFELFRRSLHNPEILTFDELYERAAHIVSLEGTSGGEFGTAEAAVLEGDE